MRMKEKGNKAAGRTGPDDGIGGEWSKINVLMNSRNMVFRGSVEILIATHFMHVDKLTDKCTYDTEF